jgi:hypothetical protein
MRADDLTIRVPLKRLLISLCLIVVPLSLLGLFAITRADASLRAAAGSNLEVLASSAATRVSNYVHDRVIQVGALSRMPVIVDAVSAANRGYGGFSESAFQQKVAGIEKIWPTPAADAMVKEMLSNTAARMLRTQLTSDPRLLRLTLTDEHGAAIAATHKTLDYFQADEDFWQAIYAEGRGSVNLTDILYDEVTKTNYIGIGVPVVEPETGRFIGALDVLMDLSSVLPAAATREVGSSKQMLLVKSDGSIITGPGITLSMNMKSPEYAAATREIGAPGMTLGHLFTTLPDGREELVAFASTGLRADYKNLDWSVIVTQTAAEALAPIRGVLRLFFLYTAAGILALVALAVYFSLHRRIVYEGIGSATKSKSEMPAVAAE